MFTGANRSLGLDDKLFVLADSVLVTGLGRIALMPCLVLAARVCPEVTSLFLFSCQPMCHVNVLHDGFWLHSMRGSLVATVWRGMMVSQTGMYPALNEGIFAVLKKATNSLALAVTENRIVSTVVGKHLPKVLAKAI